MSAANRAMLNFTSSTARVAYANVWSVGTCLALGLSPIAAGAIIDQLDLLGFELCFLASGLIALGCAAAAGIVVPDAAGDFAPARPLRDLARAARITIGLDRSNRDR